MKTDFQQLLFAARNEVCEGYIFTGVCLSTGGGCLPPQRGGGGSRHPPLQADPPGQTPPAPWADTPQVDTSRADSQQAGGTYPTGMHSC